MPHPSTSPTCERCLTMLRIEWSAIFQDTTSIKTSLVNKAPDNLTWLLEHPSLQVFYSLSILNIAYMFALPSPRDVSTSSTHFILLPTRDCCPCHRYLAHADRNNVNMFCFGLLLLALLCLSNIVIEWLHWE